MQKLLLLSILLATVALPMMAARAPRPVRGFMKMIVWVLAFDFLYLIGVLYVYPRLF